MCVMHQAEPYGYLLVNGQQITHEQLARMVGASIKEVTKWLGEIERAGVYSVDETGIFSRRMVKDEALRQIRAAGGEAGKEHGIKGAEHGIKGGRPYKVTGDKKPPLDAHINPPINPPPSSSSSTSSSSQKLGSRFTLTQCPDEWIEFCKTERSDLDPKAVFTDFRDYWISVAGAKGRKADWLATWRVWVRRQQKPRQVASTQDGDPNKRKVLSWSTPDAVIEATAKQHGISTIGLSKEDAVKRINARLAA